MPDVPPPKPEPLFRGLAISNDPFAFPHKEGAFEEPGMTLLDYFAAHSIPGLQATYGGASPEKIARYAYIQASAMLAERQAHK